MPKRIFIFMIAFCELVISNCYGSKLITPLDLWRDFDPRADAIEEQIVGKWTEANVNYKEVYFTGMLNNGFGEKVRVYAIYAAPEGQKRLPAVIHLHGGGQTVSKEWLKFWTARGYAALTFNCHGRWDNREKYTMYGKLIQGNHLDMGKWYNATEPSMKVSPWYIWGVISRRAITYLETQPEVDSERIGAFGISMGGSTIWNIAIDSRIKAACAIYGVGWNENLQYGPKYAVGGKTVQATESDLIWQAGMAPQAYPPYIKCPILFLSATNDFHGNMDRSFDTLSLLPDGVERRYAFTPRFNHHIGSDLAQNLPLWMDAFLKKTVSWPQTPFTRIEIDRDGVLSFMILPDVSKQITRVDVFYAVENPHSVNRNWRTADVQGDSKKWVAKLPIMDVNAYLFAFANVHYKQGFALSSKMEAVIPKRIGEARATDRPSLTIYDGSDGTGCWTTNSPTTDPIPPILVSIKSALGPSGIKGFTVATNFSPITFQPGDKKWRGSRGFSLSFEISTCVSQEFEVTLYKNYAAKGQKKYCKRVKLEGSGKWQRISLKPEQFQCKDDSEFLDSWMGLDALELQKPVDGWKDANITFGRFEWVKSKL